MDYSGVASDVDEALQGDGMLVIHRQLGDLSYDTATGAVSRSPADATIDTPRWALQQKSVTKRGEGDGKVTQAIDIVMSALPVTTTPAVGDHVVVNGVELAIMALDGISPAGTTVAYKCHLESEALG